LQSLTTFFRMRWKMKSFGHGTPKRINHSSVLIQKTLIGKKLAKKWFLFTLNWMVQWPLLPLGMFIFWILTNLLRIRSRMQTCFRHWLCSLQSSICRLAHRGSSLPDSRSSRSTGFRSGLTGFRSGSTRSDFRLSSKRDLFSRLRRFERWDTQLNEQIVKFLIPFCILYFHFKYVTRRKYFFKDSNLKKNIYK